MSDPRVNIEEQERRHRGPMIGMILGLLFVALLAIFLLMGRGNDETVGAADTDVVEPTGTTVVVPSTGDTTVPGGTVTTVPATN